MARTAFVFAATVTALVSAETGLREWMLSTGMNASYLDHALELAAGEAIHSVDDVAQLDGPRLDAIFGLGLGARFERKLRKEADAQTPLDSLEDRLQAVLKLWFAPGDSFYSDWKMLAGVAIFLGCCIASMAIDADDKTAAPNSYNVRSAFLIIGINLIVLTLAQDTSSARALMVSMLLLNTCTLGIGASLSILREPPSSEKDKWTVSSVYANFSRPGSEVVIAALAQGFLLALYGLQACRVSQDRICYLYWIISVFSVQIWMLSTLPEMMGPLFLKNLPLWRRLSATSVAAIAFEDNVVLVSRPRIVLHCLLGAIFNGVGFLFIVCTVPLLLSQSSSPLDYVLNSFAMTFICSLDDLEPVEFFIQDGTSYSPVSVPMSPLYRVKSKPVDSLELDDQLLK